MERGGRRPARQEVQALARGLFQDPQALVREDYSLDFCRERTVSEAKRRPHCLQGLNVAEVTPEGIERRRLGFIEVDFSKRSCYRMLIFSNCFGTRRLEIS